jgi:hypothetical protein
LALIVLLHLKKVIAKKLIFVDLLKIKRLGLGGVGWGWGGGVGAQWGSNKICGSYIVHTNCELHL